MRLNIVWREQQLQHPFLCLHSAASAGNECIVGVMDTPRPADDRVVTQSVHSFMVMHVQPRAAQCSMPLRKRPIMSAGVTLPAD